MLFTIAMLVLIGSIMTFFSQEVANFMKKIASIPGATLILPLLLASTLVIYWEDWIIWIFLNFKRAVHAVVLQLVAWSSKDESFFLPFMNFIVLLLFAMTPGLLAKIHFRKNPQLPLHGIFLAGLMVWLLVSILLTVNYSYSIGGGFAE